MQFIIFLFSLSYIYYLFYYRNEHVLLPCGEKFMVTEQTSSLVFGSNFFGVIEYHL